MRPKAEIQPSETMGEGADPRCWLTLAVVLGRIMILLDVTVVIVAIP